MVWSAPWIGNHPPVPSRVSSMRVGVTGTYRNPGPVANVPVMSTITSVDTFDETQIVSASETLTIADADHADPGRKLRFATPPASPHG